MSPYAASGSQGRLAVSSTNAFRAWSQTLSIRTLGTLRQIKGAPACCAEGLSQAAVHEEIEADVPFISLASEPTGQRLDRHRAGHSRRVLVWAALAMPSTPEAASIVRRMMTACRRPRPTRPSPPTNDLLQERIKTFGTR